VLDEDGEVRASVKEMLEKENDVKIAKLSWLSRKDALKAYGSMVVYVTKRADAARLLEGQYFDVDGESAFTRVFEPRHGPMQCFKCLGLGHKAFSCTGPQLCSRCAQPGHRHSECQTDSPKCAVCSGPHDSSAASVGFSIRRLMSRSLRFLQLNVQKRRNVQHSVMNDVNLKEYAALVLSEPYVFEMDGKVTTSPIGHQDRMAILPSKRHFGRWAVRSMLWVRRDIDCEQMNMPSADLTVALLQLPDQSVLLASVHVEGGNVAALSGTMSLLNEAIHIAQRRGGPRLDIVVASDFNRLDQLWGGDGVPQQRQGEADPINDFMNKWSLESLLPRGTTTWQNRMYATTIDLMLASQKLASSVLKCKIHKTEHGSDHRAVETLFDVEVPEHAAQPQLLFKNAIWTAIRERITHVLQGRPPDGDVQRQTDRLMRVVLDAVSSLTPKAKPTPYAKRW
jgi:hypothetical protein